MPDDYTPGPWAIRHDTNVFATRRDTRHFGVIANTGGHSANFVDCTAENEANARLVAAAPWLDLLARAFAGGWTLDRAMLYDEEGVDGWRLTGPRGAEYSWVGDLADADEKTFRDVRAAVAKAEGRDAASGHRD